MKKRNLFISLAMLAGVICVSCEKEQQSLVDIYFDRQDQSIQSFIETEGFEILSKYPDNGVFEKNQFVLLRNGCYLHVIDSGNGNRPIPGQTNVLMYLKSYMIILPTDNVIYKDATEPMRFTFGWLWDKSNISDPTRLEYYYLGEGVVSALEYVSENAKVRMIVPFDTRKRLSNRQPYLYLAAMPVGSKHQITHGYPLYYHEIVFEFESTANKLE